MCTRFKDLGIIPMGRLAFAAVTVSPQMHSHRAQGRFAETQTRCA
jgi:hypothetical protein